ncbi:multicomponent Na+:H+ antiporter subunit E [Prauserella isguenensis]|uniref:Multicomponent Na+:H+ antiporter subunit E n=1 Tax=Prauserella isguenensis TaxID=1470180 RepID=A0A839S7D8_9PSEU|nr:Na+/H+ antiporter subunit E [Prauserella isguenensis]MBB3053302.1 multicomponent Na+:H+ antiporter subunit E [Prauserella isguenensis]
MPRRRRHGNRIAPSLMIWLVVVWMLLWGTFDVATAVYGLLVALIVLVVFPLPSHRWNIFHRPWRLVILAGYVIVDLVGSAVRFFVDTLRESGRVSAAIMAVPVLSDVDHVIASAANVVSLAPGTFVLQIDRSRGIWYVYTTGVRTAEDAHKAYDNVVDMQHVVVWAFGDEQEAPAARSRAEEAKRERDRSPVCRPQQPSPVAAVAASEAEFRNAESRNGESDGGGEAGADGPDDVAEVDENRREDR